MKKILLFIVLISSYRMSFSQNTFPSSGDVGIGTSSPLSLLDIVGSSPILYMRNTAASLSVLKIVPYSNGDVYFETGSSTASDSRANLNFTSMNGSANFMTIQGSTGDVGIGTADPTGKLTVAGITNYYDIQFTGNSSQGVGVSLQNKQSGGREFDIFSSGSSNAVGVGNFGIYDKTAAAFRIVINSSGNVLIGKISQTNHSYKLDVNGNIRANQVTVNATGADYVFSSNYKLPSLDSVNAYIKMHHHLPKVPSAGEMRQNGINVGVTQMVLLKKIEELTLYQINANERINKLQDKLSEMEEEIRQLKNQPK